MTDTDHAQLNWDEHGQPLSSQFDDVYFSNASGLAESQHVFIQHNQCRNASAALERWSYLCDWRNGLWHWA